MKKISKETYDKVGEIGKYVGIGAAVLGLLEAGTTLFSKVTEPEEEEEQKKKGGRKNGKA